MEMLRVRWTGKNSKRHDGKENLEYVANVVRETGSTGPITEGEIVKIRWDNHGKQSMWKAIVTEYPPVPTAQRRGEKN